MTNTQMTLLVLAAVASIAVAAAIPSRPSLMAERGDDELSGRVIVQPAPDAMRELRR